MSPPSSIAVETQTGAPRLLLVGETKVKAAHRPRSIDRDRKNRRFGIIVSLRLQTALYNNTLPTTSEFGWRSAGSRAERRKCPPNHAPNAFFLKINSDAHLEQCAAREVFTLGKKQQGG